MDINNNQQINTFAKGLDTDSSDFIIQDQSYRNANNIKLIGDKYSTNISAQLIEGNVLVTKFTDNIQVIQTCSVRDYGIIIAKTDNKLAIYTIKESDITKQPKLIFKSIEDYDIDIVSVNIRYESENNIKLYIADGEHPLLSINVSDLQYDDDYNPENTILSLYTYPQVDFKKPIFLGLTQGSLKGGMYQYSYQLYKKFGNSSEISPTTLMISVIDNVSYKNGNDINGVGQDEQSGSGIKIRIPTSESSSYLDRIKLAFNEDKYDEVLKTSYRPDCYFGFDVEKYYFLSGYNRCFLPELSLLTQINRVVMEEINNYYQNVYEVLYIYNNNKDAFNSEYERLKKRFELMYNDVEHLCARIYYINKEFIKGYEKFFNSLSYEGLIDNYEIEANINNRISNPENITIMLQREKMFDVYWSLDTNIFCHFCWLKRKLKNIFRAIGKYFQKPKICENCRCCKIKAEKK